MENYFRPGIDGLKLYSQIHHNQVNQLLHAFGMPVVGYAFFGLMNLVSVKLSYLAFVSYFMYYLTFDPFGAIVSLVIYTQALNLSVQNYTDLIDYYGNSKVFEKFKHEYAMFYVKLFCLSIFVQEFIGHLIYERISSDLLQLPNSITQAPLFATRAMLHNFIGMSLIP